MQKRNYYRAFDWLDIMGIVLSIALLVFIVIGIIHILKQGGTEKRYPDIPVKQLFSNCTGVAEMLKAWNVSSPRVICNQSDFEQEIADYRQGIGR